MSMQHCRIGQAELSHCQLFPIAASWCPTKLQGYTRLRHGVSFAKSTAVRTKKCFSLLVPWFQSLCLLATEARLVDPLGALSRGQR